VDSYENASIAWVGTSSSSKSRGRTRNACRASSARFTPSKGRAGSRFSKLQAISHVGENLLSRLRDLELMLDAHITGDWQRAVVLHAAPSLVMKIAQRMFSLGERSPSIEDMLDAFGEIANITGGNLKRLLSAGAAHLSRRPSCRAATIRSRSPGAAKSRARRLPAMDCRSS
jgi:hypothetical protein